MGAPLGGAAGSRLRMSLAWGRVALTPLALAVVLVPGSDGQRVRLALLVFGVWLPTALLQVAIARWATKRWALPLGAVLDVGVVGFFLVAMPDLAKSNLLALLVLVALYALVDTYAGGLLVAVLGSAVVLAVTETGKVTQLERFDVIALLAAAVAITGLVGYGSRAQQSSASGFASSYARTRDQLELTLEAADTGLWEWDIANDRVDWSGGTLRIFGQSQPPADLAAFTELVHPDDREMLQQRVEDSLARCDSFQVQHRIVVDGRVRWLIGKGRALCEGGRAVRLLGVVTDVTDQHEQQQQLERSRRLETVSGLAGGFAHDFNNLLAVIMMTAELHRRTGLDEDQRERVDVILEAAKRGATLSSKLLAFARRESGHPLPLRPRSLVTALEPMLRQALRADIDLTIAVPAALPAVLADRTLLEQAILNLAVNCRDAIPGSGRVLIAARHEPALDGPGHVVLEIADDGVGMTDDVRDRAFEPFFTTKGPDHGTGLGLASVYSTISALDGEVEIDSVLGRGTTVRLRLPATVARPRETDAAPTDRFSGPRASVLVVDDDPGIRRALSDLLTSLGHDVTTAHDGRAALSLVDSRPDLRFDLVVTDVVMPNVSGPELVKRLQRQGVSLPAVYMTGYVDRFEHVLPETARVLHKPFTTTELLDCLDRALSGQPR